MFCLKATLLAAIALVFFCVGASGLDCKNVYTQMSGQVGKYREQLATAQLLIELATDSSPRRNEGRLQSVRKVLESVSPMDDAAAVQNRLFRALVSLTTDDLRQTDGAFQRAVNLLKKWEQEYPPELTRERVFGVIQALEDSDFSDAEIKALNAEIEASHRPFVQRQQREMEEQGGNPQRPGFRRNVDLGHRPSPIDGQAASEISGNKKPAQRSRRPRSIGSGLP